MTVSASLCLNGIDLTLQVLQDLTYCYLHMSTYDLQVLDTLETPDFLKGDLGDDG